MAKAWHVKYRPKRFEDVVGQKAAVAAMRKTLERGSSQSFLLSGPSGTGKTTLARIAAIHSECTDHDIMEVDAATHTGIDAMRAITEVLQYKPLGSRKRRAIIIDEAHGLSRQSWDALLKAVEEPPAHILWFFCTTNVAKVPATIKTRCTPVVLKEVNEKDIETVVERVMDKEKLDLDPDVFDLVVREAHGSPRQAIVNLAACADCDDKKQAAAILRTVLESDPTIALCRFLMNGGSWTKAMDLIERLGDTNPEGVRIVAVNYLGSALKNANSDKRAIQILTMLDAFSQPYNQAEGTTPLMMSVGRCLFNA